METENNENLSEVSSGKKSNMKQRVITGTVYVVVLLALLALKWLVPQGWGSLGFDAVFCALSVLGSLEFLRALNANGENSAISLPQYAFTVAFCALIVPLFVVMETAMGQGLLAMACAFALYLVLLTALSVFHHGKSTIKGTFACVFVMLYCGVLSAVLSAVNHLPNNSMAAILVLFLCPVLTDTFAFATGSAFKRIVPLKLAPSLSPNKTVIGAVGGIVGGVVGAAVAYFIIRYAGGLNGGYNGVYLAYNSAVHPVVCFVLAGLLTSVTAQIGDLFESALKRECGVKDMGKLLPGHGGVLDRFDSMLYCGLVVLLCFATFIA